MPLTPEEIRTFARSSVKNVGTRAARLYATGRYLTVLDDIRDSGFRVTSRVSFAVWAELRCIEQEAHAEPAQQEEAA